MIRIKAASSKLTTKRVVINVLALIVLLVAMFPILVMISTSLKTPLEFMSDRLGILPSVITFEHYYEVIMERGFLRFLSNTTIVSIVTTLLAVGAGSMAAYSLTRFRFPRKLDAIFLVWALVIRTIPPIVLVIPLFIMFRALRISNVRLILILAYQVYTLPLAIWMLIGFFREIPKELEYAAMTDGASRFQAMVRVVYPLVLPGLAATAIFCIIQGWNEFTYALIFARSPQNFTVPIGISSFLTEYKTLWGSLTAGGLISSLPLLLFTAAVQRHLLRGFGMRGVH
ncbi:MAG TPA: sugar ABC transporter permease [Firmicutes bacterium]|nr:sugar ABC transporter permease [Bacillota bacterium]